MSLSGLQHCQAMLSGKLLPGKKNDLGRGNGNEDSVYEL